MDSKSGWAWQRREGSRLVFDANGRLQRREDGAGNQQILHYDWKDRLTSVTDVASSRALTFGYHPGSKLLASIPGPATAAVGAGKWVSYTYDGLGNCQTVTCADGAGFTSTYADPSAPHNPTAVHDRAGALVQTWAYGSQDRATAHGSSPDDGLGAAYPSPSGVAVTDRYGILRTRSPFPMAQAQGGNARTLSPEATCQAPSARTPLLRFPLSIRSPAK
ncbi:MAG: RHS repeat domain-containing protein [Thermodesulfobacteriota bacterium]